MAEKTIRLTFKGASGDALRRMAENTIRPLIEEREREAAIWAHPAIGQEMPDGSIYAGETADGTKLFVTPRDAPGPAREFNEAAAYAKELNAKEALGRSGWHIPTPEELDVLFANRKEIGGFTLGGKSNACSYWSSAVHGDYSARFRRFNNGAWDIVLQSYPMSVRAVCSRRPGAEP